MTKPTVLFVHGAWHTPKHFEPIRKVFEKAGYPTLCLINTTIDSLPPIGLKDDAQNIRNELERLVEREEKDVILVAHSYGGVVITEAVDQRFAKKEREEELLKGGVLHLVYMCAIMPSNGQSLKDQFDEATRPRDSKAENGMPTEGTPQEKFFHDLPESEQLHWVEELRPWPINTLRHEKVSQTAYLYHPVTYLFCENDRALIPAVQRMMVEKVKSKGVKVHEQTCSASHSPFLSMPERVLEVVQTIG